jgi:Kdo2-lipid IVA lauroyltransferase/acyltransferase
MDKIGYYLLRATTWIIHLFPLRLNYIFSDFLYLIIYYIVRYRRNVVSKNLLNSFSGKSIKERKVIEKKFYHHLCDTFIETLYYDRISFEEAKDRVKFLNPELPIHYLDQGRPVVVYLGHYNNWEWFSNWPLYTNHRFYAIYKKLQSKAFGRFFYNLRSRLGAIPLERSDTFRQLMGDAQKGIPTLSAFIFDQTPRIYEIQYWTTFLNQDTAVVVGAEKVARKLNAVVVTVHPRKIRRGYYEVEYFLVTENAKDTEKFEITEKCTRFLEKIILEKPEYWLWSHKRWKHKRPKK